MALQVDGKKIGQFHDLLITGDLTVEGTSTTTNDVITTALEIEDTTGASQFVLDGAASPTFGQFNSNELRNVNAVGTGDPSTLIGDDTTIADGPDTIAVGIGAEARSEHNAAFGIRAKALDNDGTALGTEAVASNRWNTVVGYDAGNQNNGRNIVLVGRLAVAPGDSTVAIGEEAEATADRASVLGRNGVASGVESTAVGNQTEATAEQASSFGQGSVASGKNAVAFGQGAEASGDSSTALGRNSLASATNALAIGTDTEAVQANAFSFGDRNVNLPENRSFLYPPSPGDEVLFNLPVDSSAADGDSQSYGFQMDGVDTFRVQAEADGSGGVDNRLVEFSDRVDIASGAELTAGEIETREDDLTELVDTPVTTSPTAGTEVGYRFQIDNSDVVRVSAGADGSGGIQNNTVEVTADLEVNNNLRVNTINDDGAGNITLQVNGNTVAQIDSNGNLEIAGTVTEGVTF